jgi:hypothetical protein
MAHVRHEAVAAAMMRLEVPRGAGIVAEGIADLLHTDLDRSLLDDHVAPDGGEELLLRDQHAGVLDEMAQDGVGLGAEPHPRRSAVKGGGARVEAKRAETSLHGDAGGLYSILPNLNPCRTTLEGHRP